MKADIALTTDTGRFSVALQRSKALPCTWTSCTPARTVVISLRRYSIDTGSLAGGGDESLHNHDKGVLKGIFLLIELRGIVRYLLSSAVG